MSATTSTFWKDTATLSLTLSSTPVECVSSQIEGRHYLEILAEGGGILSTVDHTRQASPTELLDSFLRRLRRMIRSGTTTVEVKSGYGLDAESEIKMLRVVEAARPLTPLTLSSTFCVHAVPRGVTAEQATEAAICDQLPRVRELVESGGASVDSLDVFCESGVFDVDQTHRILEAGRKAGFRLNFHAEELSCLGAAENLFIFLIVNNISVSLFELYLMKLIWKRRIVHGVYGCGQMGSSLGAEAVSHLEEVSQDGIQALARAGSVAVLLPGTVQALRLTVPPVRTMVSAGLAVALGSDFNPNCYCTSMPLTMYLACVLFRMTPEEALVAATLNAAASLGLSHVRGSIEVDKMADMLVLDCPTLVTPFIFLPF
ncbi:AMDHD1 [Cordylochernes scorpioides]|uniref:Probable imidazolonepropionase n=1 Tax=Cordylochernes scorpioides TaxID=51811 RepID=A0ABY6KXZ6_9ARAC|nr:AMDHD1 [Cordylochernes scorpioides]